MTSPKDKPKIDLTHVTTRHHRGGGDMADKSKGSGRARDAGSGEYVTKKYADKHPKTTVVEHDKSKKKK
jgi:hypothetical protein